ncbi:hypothetical protein [Duganella sp. Root1480D1]|uniref:hypothetical protein n=1 Tax=Duganella sp. Root1480D1 TaxID=1736471 RepID=UPI000AB2B2DC|nr:hypothetical protein [Duganella sp. Root1480D1]
MRPFSVVLAALLTSAATSASGTEPEAVVRAFFDGLMHERFENRFGLNKEDQFSLLSAKLQDLATAVECNTAHTPVPDEDVPKPPPNSSADATMVFDRWDHPSACLVARPRIVMPRALVNVECSWDGTSDHEAGEHMTLHVEVKKEQRRWVISNIRHGEQSDGAETATSLVDRLRTGASYEPIPAACRAWRK